MALLTRADGATRSAIGRRPTTLLLMVCALLLVLVAALFLWRSPPAIARLLPEADAIVYADLRPLRLLTRFDRHPVAHSPEYQGFIDSTGIVPERDLDRVAFALHRMPDPTGPNGTVGYSEVFRGSFDASRLAGYLRSLATDRENYAGREIDTIPVADPTPHGTRLLRVAVLDGSTIAASNMPSAEQIHAMIDAGRSASFLRSGPSLLSASYARVPVAASVWGVGALALPFVEQGHVAVLGLRLPIPPEQPMVASLRYTTALHLRLELMAGGEAAAATQAEALRGMLGLLRALMRSGGTAPPEAAALLASIEIEQEHDATLLQAVIPIALLRTLAGSGAVAELRDRAPGQPEAETMLRQQPETHQTLTWCPLIEGRSIVRYPVRTAR